MPKEEEQTRSPSDTQFFDRNDVLRCYNETIYDKIVIFATQLSILGYSDTALTLISKLNRYDWHHMYVARLRPLYILWNTIDRWPEGESKRLDEEIYENRKSDAESKVVDESSKRTRKKRKLELDDSAITAAEVKRCVDESYHSYAKCWWYPDLPYTWDAQAPPSPHDPDVNHSVEEVRRILRHLIGAVRGEKEYQRKEGMDANRLNPSAVLVSALELRIKLRGMDDGTQDELPSEEEILGMIAKRLTDSNQIELLTQSRRAWPMLLDGALLRLLGLEKAKIDAFASELEDAITERFKKGRQPYRTLSMKEVLDIIEENTRTHPGSVEWYKEMDRPIPATILHPPATASLISDTETRLDCKLPSDYKEYFSITNGSDAAFSGIINEPPLLKCEDLRWISDNEEYLSELPIDIPMSWESRIGYNDALGLKWPEMGRAIKIGTEDVDLTFLVPPETMVKVREQVQSILESSDENATEDVKNSVRRAVEDFAGSMQTWDELDWCCVTWKDTAMEAHCSFGAYLRSVAENGRVAQHDCWNVEYNEFFAHRLVD